MEAPLEDETPAGALAGIEVPDHGEELKASDEALTLMSSFGEFSVYFLVYSKVSPEAMNSALLRVGTTWFWHILSCLRHKETFFHVSTGNRKTASLNGDSCPNLSLLSLLSEPAELQKCVFPDSLVTVSESGRDLGRFSVSVEFARRGQQTCMLLHAQSQGAIDDSPCGTTVTGEGGVAKTG